MAWFKKLEECLEAAKDREGHSYACLSTMRGPASGTLRGRPANRTVNIRSANITDITIIGDLRSAKADDILNGISPFGEICWWFSELEVQFRLSGRVELISSGTTREEAWNELGPEQREWFALPAPGSAFDEQKVDTDASVVNGAMPVHFCICKLHIDFVDVFGRKPMQREQFQKDGTTGEWTRLRVHC